MTAYDCIKPSGGDTGAPLNLKRRMDWIARHCELRDKFILDCGCGTGNYVQKFLAFSPHVYGIEYEEEKVRTFQALHRTPPAARTSGEPRPKCRRAAQVAQGVTEALPFKEDFFDVVLLNEVLEHVFDETKTLHEIRRVLKPKGFLVLFSPNRLHPFETHGAVLKMSGEPVPHFAPFIPYIPTGIGQRFLEYRARNYFPWELKRILMQHGFTVLKQEFVWQTFENISGKSPAWVIRSQKILRAISLLMEKIPGPNCFGGSQVILARKASSC